MIATVIGGGSWGTALASKLAKNDVDTTLYIRNTDQYKEIKSTHINERYLPGVNLPTTLKFSNDLLESIKNSKYLILSVPTNNLRSVLEDIKDHIDDDVVLINTAKGIEENTLLRLSQVAEEILPNNSFVAFSGPTHAEEVVLDYPSSIVSACEDLDIAKEVQDLFMSDSFRVYTNDDVIGVEISGALKNIMAIASGILVGMEYGDNSSAALLTRGINEMARLGVSIGAKESTFLGLAGIGDLIVTCTSPHSRNRRCGELLGQGVSPKEAIEEIGMVVEGIKTTNASRKLFKDSGIEMPIIDALYSILYEDLSPSEAVIKLMSRAPKHEMMGFYE